MKRFLFVSFFLLASLAGGQAQDPPQCKPVAHGPRIVFEETIHLFGDISTKSDGNCEFVFTNEGNEPLILSEVRSSCGCTTPTWSKEPVMPGYKGSLKVHYDTGRKGDFNKTVTVKSNAANAPSVVLKIRGRVK